MKTHKMVALAFTLASMSTFAETLYNGIELPKVWPPRYEAAELKPMPVPYLEPANIPAVIPINLGRQLFVDDFLVESSEGIVRIYGKPKKYLGNPRPLDNVLQSFPPQVGVESAGGVEQAFARLS